MRDLFVAMQSIILKRVLTLVLRRLGDILQQGCTWGREDKAVLI